MFILENILRWQPDWDDDGFDRPIFRYFEEIGDAPPTDTQLEHGFHAAAKLFAQASPRWQSCADDAFKHTTQRQEGPLS